MTQPDLIVGIDVSKDRLDVFVSSGVSFMVANSTSGVQELVQRVQGARAFALEASGGYEALALHALAQAGLSVYRLDPGRVRSFARGLGQRAKTDAIDARMIALCLAAGIADLHPYQSDAATQTLAELVALRRQFVGDLTGLAGRVDRARAELVRELLAEQAATLRNMITRLDARIAETVAGDDALARKAARLRSAPGVGPVLAATLTAGLPELGQIGSRKIAALIGVAPYDRQSGRRAKPGRCAAGRGHIRKVLYMAAMAAIRAGKNPFARTYQHLTGLGKPAKLAIVAVMRKMIVVLNAMLRDDRAWHA